MPYVTSAERFGIRKGLQQGIEKGLRQGLEKGIQKGVKQGVRKGMEQGQVLAYRESVLELLKARLGTVPKDLRGQLKAETSLQRLRRWLRVAATCPKAEDLRLS